MAIFEDIADASDALCNPRENSEPRHEWDIHRNKKPLKPHKTIVPGLIQQLRDLAEPGVDGEAGGDGGPESVPVNLEAVSLLASIEHGSRWRAAKWGINLTERHTAEDYIRGLTGAVKQQISNLAQLDLCAELRSWQRQAEVITGWRTPSLPLNAPCMACGAKGSLRARADNLEPSATCGACGESWGPATVGLIAEHVLAYQRRVDGERSASRTRAVESRRRWEIPRASPAA